MGRAVVPLKPVRDVPHVSSVHVDVDLIRDRNLAWCRTDLGDLEELAASLKEYGFQLPILLTAEYEVADGARRFVAAADLLGLKTVPVKVTSDWEEVVTYFDREHWLTNNGWPHLKTRWADINTLANGPFRTLNKNRRATQMLASRSKGLNGRRGDAVDSFNASLAPLFGLSLPDLLVIRQMTNYLKKIKEDHPKLHQECVQTFENAERGLLRIHSANTIIAAATHGVPPSETKIKGGPTNPNRRRYDQVGRGVGISSTSAVNAANTLAALGDQFEWVRWVDGDLAPKAAAEAVAQIKTAVLHINRLRRLLESHTTGDMPTQGESK